MAASDLTDIARTNTDSTGRGDGAASINPSASSMDAAAGASTAIPLQEYRERRERLLAALNGAAAVVLAGSETGFTPVLDRWKADPNFVYLTGLSSESGAALLFDPSAANPEQRLVLFLRPRDPEREQWEGVRPPLDSALQAETGFATLRRTGSLPSLLTQAARRTKRLACLHPFASYDQDVSPDLALFHRICERVPGVVVEDQTQLLAAMRAVKSPAELQLLERAVAITAAGFAAALRFLRPGVREDQVEQVLTTVFRERDAQPAFAPIVGTGTRSAILHCPPTRQVIQPDDLVVIDYGAACGGYAADITRTFPASGVFTAAQREVYEVVLAANLAAIAAVHPGATHTEVDSAARRVIEDAGFGDAFLHSTSHPLGLEVHDVAPDGPLRPGMVITIEPGVYLPGRGFGIRIEDDVLVTEEGCCNLTAAVPKTIAAVEAAMKGT